MHMPQLQKQHSLPQTRQLTSAMLSGNKIAAVQNTLHGPCTLTCTTDQALLTTQPFTYKTNNIWHTQHAAINFHMCTHFQYAMHCTPKFNHSTFFYNYSLVYLLLFHLLQFRLLSFRLLDIFTSICSSNSYPTQISRTIKCAMKHTSYTYKFTTF